MSVAAASGPTVGDVVRKRGRPRKAVSDDPQSAQSGLKKTSCRASTRADVSATAKSEGTGAKKVAKGTKRASTGTLHIGQIKADDTSPILQGIAATRSTQSTVTPSVRARQKSRTPLAGSDSLRLAADGHVDTPIPALPSASSASASSSSPSGSIITSALMSRPARVSPAAPLPAGPLPTAMPPNYNQMARK